jgi:hypothetical protein
MAWREDHSRAESAKGPEYNILDNGQFFVHAGELELTGHLSGVIVENHVHESKVYGDRL